MNELTNKDGVPIRVGQAWDIEDMICEVCAFADGVMFYVEHGTLNSWMIDHCEGMKCRLISDPVWGSMEEWRIVTDDEKREHKLCKGVELWCTTTLDPEAWHPILRGFGGCFVEPLTYRIPLDFDFEAEHEGASFICRECGKDYFHSKDARYCCPTPDCNKAAKVCECRPEPEPIHLIDPSHSSTYCNKPRKEVISSCRDIKHCTCEECTKAYNNFYPERPPKPCSPGCMGHLTHPCEKCGQQWIQPAKPFNDAEMIMKKGFIWANISDYREAIEQLQGLADLLIDEINKLKETTP
jgi:hypothetical protein